MEWKSIEINLQNIETNTGNAILIKCPKKSSYNGYVFWFPAKLVKQGKHLHACKLNYNETFVFTLKKYNKKHELVDEIDIDVNEFENMFEVMNQNIRAQNDSSYLLIHEPEKLQIDKVEIPKCLQNN